MKKSIVVGDLTMTNHRIENGRRKFLVTVAGGIAGLAAGSLPARVLAQPPGGTPLSISTQPVLFVAASARTKLWSLACLLLW